MGCFPGGLPGWAWPVGSIPACGGSLLEWEAVGEALQSGSHWLGSTLKQSSDKLRLLGKAAGEAAQWGETPDCAPCMEPIGEAD